MTVNPAIAAMLQAKLAQQAGAPAPMDPAAGVDPLAAPAPFPSTDPNAVAGLLDPLAQAQQADQAALADQQAQAAQLAMQDTLSRLANGPKQGGPGFPVSPPVGPAEAVPSGNSPY